MNEMEARRAEYRENLRRRKAVNRLNRAVSGVVFGGMASLLLLAGLGVYALIDLVF